MSRLRMGSFHFLLRLSYLRGAFQHDSLTVQALSLFARYYAGLGSS